MAAHLLLGVSCFGMAHGKGLSQINNRNMRSGQPYGTWTEDFRALITVGNSFTIPREDLFDHPESVQGGDLQKFCQGFVKQQQKHEEIHCFGSIEEVLSKYGNILDRVPYAKDLDGSSHIVMSSREVAKEKEAAVCHIFGGNSLVCHLVPVTLHEVVTQVSDGSSRTLRVACHPVAGGGCHVLFPGDVIVSRPVTPPTVKFEKTGKMEGALDWDHCSDLSRDHCNDSGCCWHQISNWPSICLPCGANATITGVAEQELGLALSQIPTSKPLKQYAALGNSFTANDTFTGVVEQEPDMALGGDGYGDCKDFWQGADCKKNRGCCWDWFGRYGICSQCGANDTFTGVAQYAALRNSFTTSDVISGVVEQESEMMV